MMLRRALVGFCFIVLWVACSAPKDPAAAAAACSKDSDCVLVKGDLCNRCGSCPGDPIFAMTNAQIEAAQKEPGCAARLGHDQPTPPGSPPPPPPSCSPCPAGTQPSGAPACVAGRCAIR